MIRPLTAGGKPAVVKAGEEVVTVTPVRFSKSQKTIFVIPFECESDNGTSLDKGYIAVNTKTGRLTVEHCSDPIPMDVDMDAEDKE
jgi:hypothetical protein